MGAGQRCAHRRVALQAADHGCMDETWPNRVDAYPLGPVFQCSHLGQTHHPMLGSGIGWRIGKADRAQYGCHVDDGAAAGLQHGGNLVFHAEEHAGEIDPDDLVPGIQRVVRGGSLRATDARVVACNIQPPEMRNAPLHQLAGVLGIADVGCDKDGVASLGAHHVRGLLAPRGIDVGDDHPGAFTCPAQGDGAANARPAACYQCNLVFQHKPFKSNRK
jgi:hypothetical protein